MLKLLFCFVATFIVVKANGDFIVLHSPDSIVFNGDEEVEQSFLKDVLAVALGFTIRSKGTWSGMSITNPFSLPEAIVSIAIEGIDSLDIPRATKFPLNVNEVEETTWQALRERLEERDNDNTLVRIYLSDGVDALGQSALGELKTIPYNETSLRALSLKREEDKKFLEEVQLLHAIAKKARTVIKPDAKSDIYWLVLSGLRPVFDVYGSNSTTSKEALMLLINALNVIHDAFIQAYDGQVLIVAFTNDASKVHHIRSVTLGRQKRETNETQNDRQGENKKIEDGEDSNTNIDSTSESNSDMRTSTASSDLRADSGHNETHPDLSNTEKTINSNIQIIGQDIQNLGKNYSKDYPVMFNIFLWFGVAFVFSLLAICIAIAQMDPGRDSIIYRMTSNRMKKDN